MHPLSDIKADGTLRVSGKKVLRVHAALKKAVTQAKRTNGRPPFDKRGSQARRIFDLMRDYLGRDVPDEAALALARAAALTTVRIERLEEREVKGLEIDDERLVRLSGSLARTLTALRALKTKPQSGPSDSVSPLQRHLEQLARKAKAAQ
jgi:hypothetical protein